MPIFPVVLSLVPVFHSSRTIPVFPFERRHSEYDPQPARFKYDFLRRLLGITATPRQLFLVVGKLFVIDIVFRGSRRIDFSTSMVAEHGWRRSFPTMGSLGSTWVVVGEVKIETGWASGT